MLPFRDQKGQREIELGDDDLVVVEDAGALRPMQGPAQAAARRKHTLPPGSRRVLEERVEEDVAGQCLASLAASRSNGVSSSSSHIRAAVKRPPPMPVSMPSPPSSRGPASVSRLPSISAPPFLRAASGALVAQVPGVRDSSPPPAFVRRSSSSFPAAAPASLSSLASLASVNSVNSIAPVSTSRSDRPLAADASSRTPPEHTLIVVRERPRAAWIFAAAAFGALGAMTATRFLSSSDVGAAPAQTTVTLAAPAPAPLEPPPSVVVTPPTPPATPPTTPATPARPAPPPAVMSFADDQGVAIKVPSPQRPATFSGAFSGKPTGAAAPPRASRPAAPARGSMGAALPDGSFGLGATGATGATGASGATQTLSPAAPSTPPAPPAPAAPPEPPRKRALTPEQQLAEAQLKASMK